MHASVPAKVVKHMPAKSALDAYAEDQWEVVEHP